MKRIAIFAHYDRQSIIDDYVVIYLESLKESVDKIIFVSDCILSADELKKIDHVVFHTICEEHGEYDFGSYKRGIFFIENSLENYDELIILNDSCYLISSLEPIFKEMAIRRGCDFWGLSQNQDCYPEHVQSYFLVFNKKVFTSEAFLDFFHSIKKEKNKSSVILNYEIGLTTKLVEAGYIKDSFIKKIFKHNPTCSENFFSELVPAGFPLIKIELLLKNPENVNNLQRWLDIPNITQIKAIQSHIYRIRNRISQKKIDISPPKIDISFLKIFRLLLKNGYLRIKFFGLHLIKKKLH